MKIAVGIRSLTGLTGTTELVLRQLQDLHRRGFELDVFGEKLNSSALAETGARPIRLWRWPGPGYWSRRRFADRVAARVRRGHYAASIGHGDLIQQDFLFVHNLTAREHELLGRVAVHRHPVTRLHAEIIKGGGFGLLVANSELARADLCARYDVPPEKIRVVCPGYDPDRFRASDRRAGYAAARAGLGVSDEFLVAFVTSGNFPLRGADILVDTLSRLPGMNRSALRVLVAGAAHNTRAMYELFAARGLESLLIVQPKIQDVQRYYQAADLLFHPARLETFGLVVLEAAACGTAVLTSRAVGAAELLPGFTVCGDVPDAGLFARQLAALMDDRNLLDQWAVVQQMAVVDHTWARYTTECFELFREFGLSGQV